jgi:hypothetical protein
MRIEEIPPSETAEPYIFTSVMGVATSHKSHGDSFMHRRTALTICLMAVLTFSWSAAIAHASSATYTIHDGKVSVDLSLDFYQNATAMPNVNQSFTGAAAQNLTSAIQESLMSEATGTSVNSLSGDLRSSRDWINATIRFDVTGVASQKGSLLNVNCSWIRFKVPGDLRLGNVSYNRIGATYIRPAFEKYVDFDKPPLNKTIGDVIYASGTTQLPPVDAVQRAGNATLLDFTYIAAHVEDWRMTYNLTKASTTWVYNPGSAAEMDMAVKPRVENPFDFHASYAYNATISVEGLAQAHGDVISTDVSGGYEPVLMLIVVIATFVIAVVASWVYRSRRKRLPRRRK